MGFESPDTETSRAATSEENTYVLQSIEAEKVRSASAAGQFFRETTLEELARGDTLADFEDAANKYLLAIQLSSNQGSDKVLALSLLDEVELVFKSFANTPSDWFLQINLFRAWSFIFIGTPESTKEAQKLLLQLIPVYREHGDKKHELLSALEALSFTYMNSTPAQWARAVSCHLEIISLHEGITRASKLEIARQQTVLSTCLHMKSKPDWDGAFLYINEALETIAEIGTKEDRVSAYNQKAWICLAMPATDTTEAARCYEVAIELLNTPKDRQYKAQILDCLADCLINHNLPPLWAKGTRCMEESVDILFSIKSEDIIEAGSDLYDLYWQHPTPQMTKAAALCDKVASLNVAKRPETQSTLRFFKAQCLENCVEPNWGEAIRASEESVKFARKSNNPQQLLASLQQLGYLYIESSSHNIEEAAKVYKELLSLSEKHLPSSTSLHSSTLHNLAWCLINQDKPDREAAYIISKVAIGVARKINGSERSVHLTSNLTLSADICMRQLIPLPEEAVGYYKESLKYLKSQEKIMDRALVLNHLSYLYYSCNKKDWNKALEYSEKAIILLSNIKFEARSGMDVQRFKSIYASTLGQCASIYQNKNKPNNSKAIELYEQSLPYLEAPQNIYERAQTLRLLVPLYIENNHGADAIRNLEEAIYSYRQLGQNTELGEALSELAFILIGQDNSNWDEIALYASEANSLLGPSTDISLRVQILQTLSMSFILQTKPDWESALEALKNCHLLVSGNSTQILDSDELLQDINEMANRCSEEIQRQR